MSTRLFALIVGIDSYKAGHIWNLHSCVEDATNVKEWLTSSLRVPKDQICVLLDNEATKQNIEDSFMKHLVNNPSIQQHDAILVYFAGHGSALPAPKGWYDEQVSSPASVQVLCPYDHDTRASQGRVAGISDRSLHALMEDLSASKGDNITLILDCCFNPAQTPGNTRDRRFIRWTPTRRATADDLYRGLWSSARGRPRASKLGFFAPGSSTHILLAACSKRGIASEDKQGGKLTITFLRAMSELPLHRTSYNQLADHLHQVSGESQKFVCIGKHRKRVLFNEVPFEPDNAYSSATLDTGSVFKVEIGAIHGIAEGSEFSLHLHNYRFSRNPSFASAVVSELHPTWCYARIKTRLPATPQACWAKVTRWNNRRPFRVNLKSTFTSFFRMWKLRRKLSTNPGDPTSNAGFDIVRVRNSGEADISLTVNRGSVSVYQNDGQNPDSPRRMVNIENRDGLEVIDSAARFNLHLLHKNSANPLRDQVQMELYQIHSDTWTRTTSNLLKDKSAVISLVQGAIYQVVIQNKTDTDLWPYLALMDPNCYSTTLLYQPEELDTIPTLPKGGCLEIGSRKSGTQAITFNHDGQGCLDSAFLKLYLSSTPVEMSLLGIEQGLPQTDSVTQKFGERADGKIQLWDTETVTLTFIRHPDKNSDIVY